LQGPGELPFPNGRSQDDRGRDRGELHGRDRLRDRPGELRNDEEALVGHREGRQEGGELLGELGRFDQRRGVTFRDRIEQREVRGRALLSELFRDLRGSDHGDGDRGRHVALPPDLGEDRVRTTSPFFASTLTSLPSWTSPARSFAVSGSTTIRWIVRLSGRAPNVGSNPAMASSERAAGVAESRTRRSSRRAVTWASWRSTIFSISSSLSAWKITTSSRRFRNSGRTWTRRAGSRSLRRSSSLFAPAMRSEPRLLVRMTSVLRKSTVRPCPSVSRPSSINCKRTFTTSAWAFSTSSKRITVYGRVRTASVSCPPSS